MDLIRIVVAGAGGRMGQAVVCSVLNDRACALVGAVEHAGHPLIGSDAGVVATGKSLGLTICDDLDALLDADALIDFTTPVASTDLARKAADNRIVHVIGTTGFDREQEARIGVASQSAVVIKSGNMSIGANVVAALTAQAARILQGFDVQVVEMHHRMKKDAPSGTALMLGRAAAGYRAADGSVGYASLRGGTVVGEHKVVFAGSHERVVLEHIAEDRTIFARGAIAAAKWGRDRKPGLYSMLDVLGFE